MDMVCDKLPEINHDFDNDPIPLKLQDGWIKTNGTTLGADNGIGVAFALALSEDKSVSHPPLELFFTVDEETGLHGAQNFNTEYLSGKKLLNIDTEEWGSIYIGCAGGEDVTFSRNYISKKKEINLKIEVTGLKGGHSGIDIHRGRLSATKILAFILNAYVTEHKNHSLELSAFNAGIAHNIIPRNASALLNVPKNNKESFIKFCEQKIIAIKEHCNTEDLNLSLNFSDPEIKEDDVISNQCLDRFLNMLSLCPHGAHKIDWRFEEELVSQSSNLAKVNLKNNKLQGEISFRFNNEFEREVYLQKLNAFSVQCDLNLNIEGYYPSWVPSIGDNPFLETAKEVFKNEFSCEAKIKAIHAGLECGLIKEKLGDIDIVSIGPNITGAHSPSESLEIKSTQDLWKFLTKFLAAN